MGHPYRDERARVLVAAAPPEGHAGQPEHHGGHGVNIRPSALPSGTGVLLAFLQRSQPGLPLIAIEAGVVQASQQCTGS